MRLKDQTSSNAYIQVQSNLKFKLRFNEKEVSSKKLSPKKTSSYSSISLELSIMYHFIISARYIIILLDTML